MSHWSRSILDILTHEIRAPATGILGVMNGGSVEPGTVVGMIDQV
jgi:hypothetical protein